MPGQRKYKIIAAFLLTAFSLNTVVGLACSLGIDMRFNSLHHDKKLTAPITHIHQDGEKHIHHADKEGNNHHKTTEQDQAKPSQSGGDKDNCCSKKVLKIQQLEKSLPQKLSLVHPNFLIAFFDTFYHVTLPSLDIESNIKQFVRSYHPPIPDIRIVIRSFQI